MYPIIPMSNGERYKNRMLLSIGELSRILLSLQSILNYPERSYFLWLKIFSTNAKSKLLNMVPIRSFMSPESMYSVSI